jgi:hypothetical protein
VQATLQGDVRLRDNELPLESHHPGQVEKKALPGSKASDNETDAGAPSFDTIQVFQDRRDLVTAPNLKVTQPGPGYDSGA